MILYIFTRAFHYNAFLNKYTASLVIHPQCTFLSGLVYARLLEGMWSDLEGYLSGVYIYFLPLSPFHTGRIGLLLCAVRPVSGRQSFQRARRVAGWTAAPAVCKVSTERGSVQAIDYWVAAGIQVTKDKEQVVNILRSDLQHLWLEPVPDPQQVIWSPADYEWQDDDYGHLQCLHFRFRYHISSTAPETWLPCCTEQADCVSYNTIYGT